MATLATLVVKLVGDVSGFSSSMDEASSRLRSAGQSMTSAGAGLTAGVTLPIVGIGVAALHMAGQFESSMNMMQAVSGATADEMAQVSDTAIALGSDLTLPGTSASDAALAMVELSRAGLSVQESMDAARGVLQLSAAAQIGNAQAATITANALNTFGLAGTEAATVANLLAGGANASSAEITDMAAAIQASGAVAASMGVPIDSLTTAIALMANAGIAGSDAGTSLKTMLMRLGAPTQESAALMRELGVSVFDASGTMLPMEQIIGQFSSALGGMTMEQRNAALATIFGADAIRAANVVLLGGTEAFNAMEQAVTAEGQAQMLAAAQTAGFQGSLDGLRSTVETVLLTVGAPFLTMLTGWVQWLSNAVGRLAEISPGMLNMIVLIGLAVAAIGPLLMVLGSMTTGLGIVAGAIGFLLSPIGLVIIAVALLAAAVVQHFGGVQATIQAASEFVQGILTALSGFVQGNQAETMGWVDQAWAQIQLIVTTIINAVEAIIRSVLTVVSGFIDAHGAEIAAFIQRAWTQIGTIINLALTLINEVITRVLGAIKQFIDQHGAEILAILTTAWNLIQALIQTVLNLIEGIIRVALAIIRGDWELAWTEVKTLVDNLLNDIRDLIVTAFEFIKAQVTLFVNTVIQWFTNLYNRLVGGSIVPDMVNGIIRWFTQLWERVQEIVVRLVNRAIDLINDLKNRVLGIIGDLVGGMYERGAGMVAAFERGIMDRLQGLLDAARRLAQQIRDLLPGSDAKTGPLSDLTASGRALPDTLAAAISRGAPTAISAVESMAGGLTDVLSMDTGALGMDAGLSWIDAMIKAIQSRLPALGDATAQALGVLGGENLKGQLALAGAGMGRPSEPAGGSERGPVTLNLNGPWYVSNEMDAKRIAEIVSEVLAGKAVTNKRLAVGWAGV